MIVMLYMIGEMILKHQRGYYKMICEMCKHNSSDTVLTILHGNYKVCVWCADIIRQYAEGRKNNSVSNIFFGFGRVSYRTWVNLRELLRANNIKDVLEFGTGLSTELFITEGCSVVSCDTLEAHINFYKNIDWLHDKGVQEAMGVTLELINYQPDSPPDFSLLYPDRRWEFVFVDGGQSRTKEIESAMKYSSKYIYLDDMHIDSELLLNNENWKRKDNIFELVTI